MGDRIVIIGNSHFSEIVFEHIIADTDWQVEAFAADKAYINREFIQGRHVVAIEDLKNTYRAGDVRLVLAVGYGNGNKTRLKLYEECISLGFNFTNYIHSSVIRAKNIEMGNGNIIFPGVTIDSFVSIGNGNIVLPQVMVGHDVKIGDFCAISGGTLLGGSAEIGDMVFLGMGAIVKDQVSVGANAYVSASSYVNKSVAEGQCVIPSKSKYLDERESQIFKEIYQ